MNCASVFSPSLTLPCLLAAASLAAPLVGAQAQGPGSIDPAFVRGATASTTYTVIREQDLSNDVRIYAAGDFGFQQITNPDNTTKGDYVAPTYGNIARLIYTAVPEQFNAPGLPRPKLLLGGLFGVSTQQAAAKLPAQNITRIFSNGIQDPSFKVGDGANNFVTSILPLPAAQGNKIVVGGRFTVFNKESRQRLVRLNTDGSIDENFAKGLAIDSDVLALAQGVVPAGMGAFDNNTLVGGLFNHVGGQVVTKLARLDANGNLDPTFKPNIDARVLAITVQKSGQIIIGGEFTSINGRPALHIARLNYDGSLDTTFTTTVTGQPPGGVDPVAVYVLKPIPRVVDSSNNVIENSGRIYVGGNFAQINGAARRYLGLINPNGTVGAFDPGATIYDKVQSIDVQTANGRVLVGETLGPKIGKNFQPSLIRLIGAPFIAIPE